MLHDQSQISANIPVVRAYGAQHADTYADLFASGEFLCVGFTADGPEHLERLKTLVPHPEILRLFAARYSAAKLESVMQSISPGGLIVAVGIDVSANVVEVTLKNLTPEAVDGLRRRLGPDFDAIRVVEGEVSTVGG